MIAQVDQLTIHYGKRVAVDGLSLTLEAGEIVLMLGPNGAGKSTTLSAMAGAILPSGGAITIAGEDIAHAPRSARRKVGFADQPPALYEFFTVAERMCDRIVLLDKGKLVADKRGTELEARLLKGPSGVEDFYVSLIADEGPT